ncbi:aminotransferase class V-fold PLP-dependent enzyme [Streptomyces sp. NPDC054933]
MATDPAELDEPPEVEPPEPVPGAQGLFTLDPTVAHLNHGSYGAPPVPVQRVQARLRDEQECDPDGFFADLPERIAAARTRISAALGAHPKRLALLTNVTEGIAVALASIPLGRGERILVTDHGYGVVTEAARRHAAEQGAELTVARLPLHAPDEAAVRDAVLAAVDDRTRVAVLDLVSSPTARRIAAPELLTELNARGVVTVVDAAHAPGMVAADVGGADFWLGNLHKWAFAPRATAVLAVGQEWLSRVRPLTVSWEHKRGFPASVEWRGTCDYTPWLAAPTGFELLERLGAQRVREHNDRLAAYGQRVVDEHTGLHPLPATRGVAMRALRLPPGWAENQQTAQGARVAIRRQLGANVAVSPWPGGGVLRISAQLYNRPEEYRALATGLAQFLAD